MAADPQLAADEAAAREGKRPMTAAELLLTPDPGKRYKGTDRKLRLMLPAGPRQGAVVGPFITAPTTQVQQQKIGYGLHG